MKNKLTSVLCTAFPFTSGYLSADDPKTEPKADPKAGGIEQKKRLNGSRKKLKPKLETLRHSVQENVLVCGITIFSSEKYFLERLVSKGNLEI